MSFIIAILCVLATCWGDYVADEVLVKIDYNYGTQGVLGVQSITPLSNSGSNGWIKVALSPNETPDEAISRLSGTPGVHAVQKNFIYYPMATPNDTDYINRQQTYMQALNLESAWDVTQGSTNIVIIDTGVDITHVDLVDNIWTNPDEIANNNIDDDNNGIVDDINGANLGSGGGLQNDPTEISTEIHGTHMAGIAAAKGFNTLGITGAAPNVSIMAIRASNGAGGFSTSSLIQAINYAITEKANIINLSLGGSGDDAAFESAIKSAYNAGITIIAAAGNTATNIYNDSIIPTKYDTTIAVGATNQSGTSRASFSNFGNHIDVVAPGVNIYSTLSTNTYAFGSGTSQAAPLVSGIAALLLSLDPSSDVRTILRTSAKDIGESGKASIFGYGFVDAEAAVLELKNPSFSLGNIDDGDAIDLNSSVTLSISSSEGIATNSISILATPASGSSITIPLSSGATYNAGTLTVFPSTAGLSAGSTTFTISAENNASSPVRTTANVTLTLTSSTTNSLTLRGPSQELDIISSPNPYDPKTDDNMIIAIHTSLSATAEIHIYSPHFKQVASFTRSLATGYNEITWVPTTDLGSGVYFLIVDATADNGSKALKRHRFAIVPR